MTHFVTMAKPKRGKLAIKAYGKIARKTDGSNIIPYPDAANKNVEARPCISIYAWTYYTNMDKGS